MSEGVQMKVGDLEQMLFEAFPRHDAEPWDNPGLCVGDAGAVVEGIRRYRMDGGLSVTSLLCLAVFVLNLPMLFKNAKHYRSLQKRLWEETAQTE